MIHMEYYLIVSTIMMFVGIYGFVTRRNLLAMLISVELILNSVDINFVVFNSPALHCSTIGASELNFSVRNGKRWDLTAITT